MTTSAGTGSTSATHARSFFSVRASSRRAGAVHHPIRDGDEAPLDPRPLPDLLMYYLLRKGEGL
jgi:hypothetical protein